MVTNERPGWERYAPLTGVVAVVLSVIGVLISESSAARPEDERAENILAWYSHNANSIITGELIYVLGVLFLIWFLGSVLLYLRSGDEPVAARPPTLQAE